MAGRALVLRIEPLAGFRPMQASIVPSLRPADAYGPASHFGPARFVCVRLAHGDGRCHGRRLSLTS